MTLPEPNPALRQIGGYRPRRSAIPVWIRLDGNEGRPPPEEALRVVRELSPAALQHYPKKAPLEAKLAARFGLGPDRVLVTNGADDALDRVARAFVGSGRSMVLPTPSFEMIPRFVAIAGGELIEVPWWQEPLDVEAVLAARRSDTTVVAVVTPNNPTGLTASLAELETIIRRSRDRVVLVDLAYAEFADEDPTNDLLHYDNVVVTRTLSKAWSFAGARVGYAMSGNPTLIAALRDAGGPYPVSSVSLALAEAWVDLGIGHVMGSRETVQREREELSDHLQVLGAEPLPSQANFVFARFPDVDWTHDALASVGIAMRAFSDKPVLAGTGRISCPQDDEHFALLRDALSTALAPRELWVEEGIELDDDPGLPQRSFDGILPDHGRAGTLVLCAKPATLTRARAAGWVSLGFGEDEEKWQSEGAARAISKAADLRVLLGGSKS
jgi:histidinol-phosphate aminotransferase